MNIENNQLINSSLGGLTRASLGLTVVALGLCGFLYSSVATGFGQLFFPEQANGSLIISNEKVVGSRLVAQPFSQERYFSARPSAANYDPMSMGGSNLARTNPELHQGVSERLNQVVQRENVEVAKIPADLVTASGSGIDPEISVAAAMLQVKRIANARQLSEQALTALVQQHSVEPTLGFIGKARVNVLELNLALDQTGQ